MNKFQGFTDSETFIPLPGSFFQHLLAGITDPGELKVTLYALWQIGGQEGSLHSLREQDFTACLPNPAPALAKAVKRGSLLKAMPRAGEAEALYFLNSPRGRAGAEAYAKGQSHPATGESLPVRLERPNIFRLYEENIGPLTPIIADALKDAEQTYPPDWVAEALERAVKNNKRSWKYVEAILRRWKEEGHGQKQDRRNAQEDGRRYAEGEFADFIEH